jgi:hypothetical protein
MLMEIMFFGWEFLAVEKIKLHPAHTPWGAVALTSSGPCGHEVLVRRIEEDTA